MLERRSEKLLRRYLGWRKRLPLGWRIALDIVVIVVGGYLAIEALLVFLILIIPFMLFIGLAKGGGQSDADWYEQNDPRGANGPHSQAPDIFH
jgi:hypothetical protein